MTSWRDKVWDFLKDEPIYADQPSDGSLVEGWKIAYQQEKDKREIAERRLKSLRMYADSVVFYGYNSQYGHDILTILNMTEEEMDEDYGD